MIASFARFYAFLRVSTHYAGEKLRFLGVQSCNKKRRKDTVTEILGASVREKDMRLSTFFYSIKFTRLSCVNFAFPFKESVIIEQSNEVVSINI